MIRNYDPYQYPRGRICVEPLFFIISIMGMASVQLIISSVTRINDAEPNLMPVHDTDQKPMISQLPVIHTVKEEPISEDTNGYHHDPTGNSDTQPSLTSNATPFAHLQPLNMQFALPVTNWTQNFGQPSNSSMFAPLHNPNASLTAPFAPPNAPTHSQPPFFVGLQQHADLQRMLPNLERKAQFFQSAANNAHILLMNERMRFDAERARKDHEVHHLGNVLVQAHTKINELNKVNEHLKMQSRQSEEREKMLVTTSQHAHELYLLSQNQKIEIEVMASQIVKLKSEVQSKNCSLQQLRTNFESERESYQMKEEEAKNCVMMKKPENVNERLAKLRNKHSMQERCLREKLNDVYKDLEDVKQHHRLEKECWLEKMQKVMTRNNQLEKENWNLRAGINETEKNYGMGIPMSACASGLRTIDANIYRAKNNDKGIDAAITMTTDYHSSNVGVMDRARTDEFQYRISASSTPEQNMHSIFRPSKSSKNMKRLKGPMELKREEANLRVINCKAYKYLEIARTYLYVPSRKRLPEKKLGKPLLSTIKMKLQKLGFPKDENTKKVANEVFDLITKEQEYQLEKGWICFPFGKSEDNSVDLSPETVHVDLQTTLY